MVELDQMDGVAVGTEGEVVPQQVEQPLAMLLVSPGGKAIEGASPCPRISPALGQQGDQLRPQSVSADRNKSRRPLGKRRHPTLLGLLATVLRRRLRRNRIQRSLHSREA